MGKLFGTDGIRGVANETLTCELAMQVGRAAAVVLTDVGQRKPVFAIGMDSRVSSDMFAGALTAGLCSMGADVLQLGLVPTPAVAHLVGKYQADAGIMISASHNPAEYNGIKLFSGDGFKLADALEDEIERIVQDDTALSQLATGGRIGKSSTVRSAVRDYVEYVTASTDTSLAGLRIAIDCANGAASATAAAIFQELGAQCHMLFDQYNGVNINLGCGSTDMQALTEYVLEHKLDAGIAFDGDADRLLCVDGNGTLLDGDAILALCGLDMKKRGKLKKDTLVGTVMTNLGLVRFCEQNGIAFVATKVGDRYILKEMQKQGYSLGGEQSGHIILLDHATTGDGQLTAVQLLAQLQREGVKLADVSGVIQRYPQMLVNICASEAGKERFFQDPVIQAAIEDGERHMGRSGRVLVRVSGTEGLIRVMTEGEDNAVMESVCRQIAAVIEQRLAE